MDDMDTLITLSAALALAAVIEFYTLALRLSFHLKSRHIQQDVIRMPRIGESLVTEVWCLDKEIKKDRKWVRAKSITRSKNSGEVLFTGIMTTLVAM